jgi:hypothetical protein
MATLKFACEEYGRAVRVQVAGGREHIVTPGEFRACVARAERQVRRGARELVLEVPGKMQLRLSDCPQPEHEAVVAAMRTVLLQCSEAAHAFAALN